MQRTALIAAVLAAACLPETAQAADDQFASTLKARGIELTPRGLIGYLRPVKGNQLADLIDRLGDANYETRQKAMFHLADLPAVPMVELEKAAKSSDAEIRRRAEYVIARNREGRHEKVLFAVLKSLRGEEYAAATPILIDLLPHLRTADLRAAAAEALVHVGQSNQSQLLRKTLKESTHTELRIAAMRTLASALGRKSLPDLRTSTDDENEEVRLAAAAAMLRFEDRRGLNTLVELLSSDDVDIRSGASWYLRTATGRTFGYLAIDKSPAKLRAAKAWKAWVERNGATAPLKSTDNVAFLASPNLQVRVSLLRTVKDPSSTVYCVAFSPDGKALATATGDGWVRVWSVADGRELWKGDAHESTVRSVVYSPDGKLVATGSYDRTLKIWDAKTGEVLRTLTGHTSSVRIIAFSPDGKLLASACTDGTIRLWDPSTGRTVRTLARKKDKQGNFIPNSGHETTVRSVAFSPDGKTVVSSGSDNTVRLWDAATGELKRTLEGHRSSVRSVAFTSDGQTIVSASLDNTVRMWDVVSGQERVALTAHKSSVKCVDTSRDGRFFVSCGNDDAVRIWDAGSTKLVSTLKDNGNGYWHVALSKDDKLLAAGGSGRRTHIWRLEHWNSVPDPAHANAARSPVSARRPAGPDRP